MTDSTPPATAGARRTARRDHAEHPVVVLGGGPAGLTAGYLLAKQGKPVIVLESTDQVGGIARTEVRDGYRFDLGGHRFFTKVKEVDELWHEIMKEEFLRRPRQSRIYWNDKFLEYPLQGMDVIRKLGPVELTRCLRLVPVGGDQAQGPRGHLRAVGVEPLRQAALPTTSSRPTPRSCGASRPTRSAPSGRRSGSRGCRSSPPPRRRSSATRATRSSR